MYSHVSKKERKSKGFLQKFQIIFDGEPFYHFAPTGAKKSTKTILGIEDIIKLFTEQTTLYRGKRVHDRFIHAYRFAVVTGLRPGEIIGLHLKGLSWVTQRIWTRTVFILTKKPGIWSLPHHI